MSARNRIHVSFCPDHGACIGVGGPGSAACQNFDELLSVVEDERLHTEAEKLRVHAWALPNSSRSDRARRAGVIKSAATIDPYELRDGQLVRKSDGKPVTL